VQKIRVASPLVELDGDEMARVVWRWIKEILILPYVDVELKYFDYDIRHRDATENRVLVDAADAIKKYRVGAKCAAINPDQARVKELASRRHEVAQQRHPQPDCGTLFRAPMCSEPVPRLVFLGGHPADPWSPAMPSAISLAAPMSASAPARCT